MKIKWIKISTDMFDDEKIAIISSMPEANAMLVIWIRLLALAGKTNDGGSIYFDEGIPYTDEMLSTIFRQPLNIVRLALATFEKFRMIERHEDQIYICNWEKHQNIEGMEKIRFLTAERVRKHRERKQLEDCNVTVTNCNATDKNKNRLDKNINTTHSNDFNSLEAFNVLLAEYPVKIGESRARQQFFTWVMDAPKVARIHSAIKNYKKHLESNDWKKPMNFNNWLEEWMDWENFVEPKTAEQKDAEIMARLKERK